MAQKWLSGQTLFLWESWVCTIQKRNHVVPCHCMLGPAPDSHLKAGFRQFSASPSRNREPWWVRDSLSLQQKVKKRYPVKVHMSKPTSIMHKGCIQAKTLDMQLCANKWRVAKLLWCQWCNPGSHRKRTGIWWDWTHHLWLLFLYYIFCSILFKNPR